MYKRVAEWRADWPIDEEGVYTIEQIGTERYSQWEPLQHGADHETMDEALRGMQELEGNLGWTGLRIRCPNNRYIYGKPHPETDDDEED